MNPAFPQRTFPTHGDSRSAQQQINYPATPDMLPWLPAMIEDIGADAPRILKGVGQNQQVLKTAYVVDRLGNGGRCWRSPRALQHSNAEGISYYFTQFIRLVFQDD